MATNKRKIKRPGAVGKVGPKKKSPDDKTVQLRPSFGIRAGDLYKIAPTKEEAAKVIHEACLPVVAELLAK